MISEHVTGVFAICMQKILLTTDITAVRSIFYIIFTALFISEAALNLLPE